MFLPLRFWNWASVAFSTNEVIKMVAIYCSKFRDLQYSRCFSSGITPEDINCHLRQHEIDYIVIYEQMDLCN